MFVDDCSRLKRVYFCMGKDEVPALLRLFLLEIDLHAVYGPHFVMRDGFRQLHAHSHWRRQGDELGGDGSAAARPFELSANVTNSPHTPVPNRVAGL